MGPKLIAAASAGAVTLDAAKGQCGIESSDWDIQLGEYILGATALAERITGRSFGVQTWELLLDSFADTIELPKGPVTQVLWVKYLDKDRTERTLATSRYLVDLVSDPQCIVRDPDVDWPDTPEGVPNAVTIRFTTGFNTTPPDAAQAIKTTVAAWFENRSMGDMPEEAKKTLLRLRVLRF